MKAHTLVENSQMLNWGLLVLFLAILAVQALTLREAFGSSQGGALVQLASSRPAYYLAAVPV
jgi:hypothetical protein